MFTINVQKLALKYEHIVKFLMLRCWFFVLYFSETIVVDVISTVYPLDFTI